MDVILKSISTPKHHISLTLTNRHRQNVYLVQVCPIWSDGLCGYPEREICYTDEHKARDTFNRYFRAYKGE